MSVLELTYFWIVVCFYPKGFCKTNRIVFWRERERRDDWIQTEKKKMSSDYSRRSCGEQVRLAETNANSHMMFWLTASALELPRFPTLIVPRRTRMVTNPQRIVILMRREQRAEINWGIVCVSIVNWNWDLVLDAESREQSLVLKEMVSLLLDGKIMV